MSPHQEPFLKVFISKDFLKMKEVGWEVSYIIICSIVFWGRGQGKCSYFCIFCP